MTGVVVGVTTRCAISCAGEPDGGAVAKVVAGAVVVPAVAVGPVVTAAAPDADRARVSEASFHGGTAPLGGRGFEVLLAAGDAEALVSFWISRSGTISTAPHRSSAAPGRLPRWILVLRTPLSLWDCWGCALRDQAHRAHLRPRKDGWAGSSKPTPGGRPTTAHRFPALQHERRVPQYKTTAR